jgi:hypothetical protein
VKKRIGSGMEMERGSEKGRGKCERKESVNWEVKVDVGEYWKWVVELGSGNGNCKSAVNGSENVNESFMVSQK